MSYNHLAFFKQVFSTVLWSFQKFWFWKKIYQQSLYFCSMRWTAHSMCCSLLSLNALLFSWPLILVRVLSTSSRSPNYLKTISANLPPRHWEMKRKLFFLFCVRFREAERGRWGQEMTKELITEVYSYFSPVHIFRDVRTKKQSAPQDIKRVKVTKILQFRLMNFLWGFTFCGPRLCDIFTMDLSLMSQFMCDLFQQMAGGGGRYKFYWQICTTMWLIFSENHSIILKWCCFTMQ